MITGGSFSDVCIMLPHESELKDDPIKAGLSDSNGKTDNVPL